MLCNNKPPRYSGYDAWLACRRSRVQTPAGPLETLVQFYLVTPKMWEWSPPQRTTPNEVGGGDLNFFSAKLHLTTPRRGVVKCNLGNHP